MGFLSKALKQSALGFFLVRKGFIKVVSRSPQASLSFRRIEIWFAVVVCRVYLYWFVAKNSWVHFYLEQILTGVVASNDNIAVVFPLFDHVNVFFPSNGKYAIVRNVPCVCVRVE